MSLQENNFPLDTDTANIFLMDEYNKKHLSCIKAFVVFIIICPPIVVTTCILVTVQNSSWHCVLTTNILLLYTMEALLCCLN